MKKILYIIPIVVFAMVGLTQDAKAQSGQTGNASNAITQGATNAVIGSALTNTSTGSNNNNPNATIVVDGTFVQTITPPINAPVVIFQGSSGISVYFNEIQNTPLSSQTTSSIVSGSQTITPLVGTSADYSVTVTADHHALITKFLIGS